MQLASSLFESGLMFSGEGQSAIDFTTDADFYEMPLKLCMQMIRPEFTFKWVIKYTCNYVSKGRTIQNPRPYCMECYITVYVDKSFDPPFRFILKFAVAVGVQCKICTYS